MPGLAGDVLGSNTNDAFLPSTSFSNTTKTEDSQTRATSIPEAKLEETPPTSQQQMTTKQEDSDEEL